MAGGAGAEPAQHLEATGKQVALAGIGGECAAFGFGGSEFVFHVVEHAQEFAHVGGAIGGVGVGGRLYQHLQTVRRAIEYLGDQQTRAVAAFVEHVFDAACRMPAAEQGVGKRAEREDVDGDGS